MPRLDVQIATLDGHSDATLHIPEGGGPWPGVVIFPDGYGARETIRQMGDRVADMGYVALVPDIGRYQPFCHAVYECRNVRQLRAFVEDLD